MIENDTQKIDKNMSLVKAASIAREKCELEFLIGAAPVIYGIPCYLKWISYYI